MFGIKTFIINSFLYPKFLFPSCNSKFPLKPVTKIKIRARLFGLLNKLKEQKRYKGLGNLVVFPAKEANSVWGKLLPYNPNNLGNWSIKEIAPNQETSLIERQLIWQMINLYHGSRDKIEGYITNGGTEANIFSAWLGRKFFEDKIFNKEKICLIKTSLTHYSIDKAADIVGINTFVSPLNDNSWSLDIDGLKKTVRDLVKQGYKGFLLPLTLGYTLTGASDSFESICSQVRQMKKEFKQIDFFIWFDAALNGLVEPFLNPSFNPFICSEVKTFLTDFHKFGFAPIPAGLVLYRRELRKLIEKPIAYLDEKDNTLSGSRSGITPVFCWTIINRLGKSGFKKLIIKRMKKKERFMEENKNKKGISFISYPYSLNCGIIAERSFRDKSFIKTFGLEFRETDIEFVSKKKKIMIAKAFF